MRVLIWGGDSWANQGDSAVLAGTLAALREMLPDAVVTVASDRPGETEGTHGAPAVRRASLGFLRALWRADLVLWGGGQLVQDASSKPFLWVQLLFLGAALLLRKPVICYGQGVGPVSGRLSRLCARAMLNRLSLITVRDAASVQKLNALGVLRPPLHITADPSFCMAAASSREGDAALRRIGIDRPFAVIAARRWGHYRGGWLPVRVSKRTLVEEDHRWFQGFCEEMATAADYLYSELGLGVLFVPMCPGGDQEDDLVAERVRGLMALQQGTYILEERLTPALLKAVLGRAELVVAMRTHAGMLAADAGAPVVCLSYQGKGEAFMDELGLPHYALPVEQMDGRSLLELVQRGWRDRAAIRAQIEARLPELRRRGWENLRLGVATASRLSYNGSRSSPASSGSSFRLGSYYRSLVAGYLGIKPTGDLVLEVGAADGQLLRRLGAPRSVALDPTPEGVGVVPFVRGDGTAAPFGSQVFDVVFAFDVLEHLSDDATMMRELARILKPGGTLWISVPSRNYTAVPPFLTGFLHRRWGHVRPGYGPQDLLDLMPSDAIVTELQWNEPAYRLLYLPLKGISLVAPGAARGLLALTARVDSVLRTGHRGHYFFRVSLPHAKTG